MIAEAVYVTRVGAMVGYDGRVDTDQLITEMLAGRVIELSDPCDRERLRDWKVVALSCDGDYLQVLVKRP